MVLCTWRRSLFWEVIDGECITIPESVIIATLLVIVPSRGAVKCAHQILLN